MGGENYFEGENRVGGEGKLAGEGGVKLHVRIGSLIDMRPGWLGGTAWFNFPKEE